MTYGLAASRSGPGGWDGRARHRLALGFLALLLLGSCPRLSLPRLLALWVLDPGHCPNEPDRCPDWRMSWARCNREVDIVSAGGVRRPCLEPFLSNGLHLHAGVLALRAQEETGFLTISPDECAMIKTDIAPGSYNPYLEARPDSPAASSTRISTSC